jgi:anti-sigma regulatory factor (Ser/Thr protein kinase)
VLARVNENLCPDIPENMFVTCFYGVLDPASGHLRYANAGHNLPLVRTGGESSELRATGMPLGLLPGMDYEERETTLREGASVLLYSDGLVEAHDEGREMFGTPRVSELIARGGDPPTLIAGLVEALDGFTGEEREQEDDITLVVIRRTGAASQPALLAQFTVASAPGNEREAMARVAEAVAPLGLSETRLQRLRTATAEATMNAMEHGNGYRRDLDVSIGVSADRHAVTVSISDQGGAREMAPADAPDIDAKLDGRQSPRGWGLFLIERMVDGLRQTSDGDRHTAELSMYLEGGRDGQREP